MATQLPHYLLTIDDSGELGIQETSFVEYPATGLGFLAFEDEKVEHTFAKIDTTEYQRITSGVLMMPNTKYLKRTKEGDYYTVEFSAQTLKDAMLLHLKQDKANVVKVEHSGSSLTGFAAIEHWIITSPDTKSPVLGNSLVDLGYDPNEIPVGTIMKSTYVADQLFWNEQILSGKVQGYSLGGLFELTPVEASVQAFSKAPELPSLAAVLKLIGVSGDNVTVTTQEGNKLTFGKQSITTDNTEEVANGTFQFNTNLKVVVKEGVIVDYGYTEFNTDAAQTTNTMEEKKTTTELTIPIVEAVVETVPTTEAIVEQATLVAQTEVLTTTMQSQLDEMNAKLTELTSSITIKDAKIAELEAKVNETANKNQALQDKLKSEPITKKTEVRTTPISKPADARVKTEVLVGGRKMFV